MNCTAHEEQVVRYEMENAAPLVGARVTQIVNDGAYMGLVFIKPDGAQVVVWVLSDTEGNGIGHLDLQPVETNR